MNDVFVLASNGADTGVLVTGVDPDTTTVRLTAAATGQPIGVGAPLLFLHPVGNAVTIASNGSWLRYDAGRWTLSAQPQEFQLLARSEEGGTACCCGPAPAPREVGIAWNDRRHAKIIEDAALIAKAGIDKGGSNAAIAKLFRDRYWPDKTDWSPEPADFEKNVLRGLKDADYKDEYTGLLPGTKVQIYYKHFYDPDTRATFHGYGENGMTEFCRRFYESIAAREVGDNVSAAYCLGLALHYLTDLTQPMHAANLINNPITSDWRHAGFEDETDGSAHDVPTYDIDVSSFNLAAWRSLGQIVTEVATYAKSVFLRDVEPALRKKVSSFSWASVSVVRYEKEWTWSEANPIVMQTIPFALRTTAALLLYWTAASTYSFVDAIYTRVLGRNPGAVDDSGLRTWGNALRSGQTMQSIVRQIALSPESISGIAGAGGVDDQIRVLFRRLLARECGEPDLAGWRGWIGAKRYADSINYVIDSAEYNQRFGPYVLPH